MSSRLLSTLGALFFVACGGGGTTGTDAGPADGAAHDGTAHDGATPLDAAADLGSVDAGPCPVDSDGDGHQSIACGGDDCDDHDANRYPTNAEVCDPSMHDEDCDPATFGALDTDHDTYVSGTCCNLAGDGSLTCGDDCNDTDPGVHPTAVEACNGRDDNCDGNVDEGVPVSTFYVDCDGDGYGVDGASTMMSCMIPSVVPPGCTGGLAHWSTVAGDCNDTSAAAHPGATEGCDGIDDNCDGMTEADADGDMHYAMGSCVPGPGEMLADDCRDDLAAVHPGVTAFSAGGICAADKHPCTVARFGGNQVGCYATGVTCPAPPRVCSGTTCPPGATFDYDCSGVEERQAAATTVACPSIASPISPCGRGDGLSYTGTPACGSLVTMRTCTFASASTCMETDTSVPLPCR